MQFTSSKLQQEIEQLQQQLHLKHGELEDEKIRFIEEKKGEGWILIHL